MKTEKTIADEIMPSATPTEDEIRRWQALPRDEQLSRMRLTIQKALDSGISDKTMDDIKTAALARISTSKNG